MADDYLSQLLAGTLTAAPELQQAPPLAVAAAKHSAKHGRVVTHAQASAHAANLTSHHKGQYDVYEQHGNVFERSVNFLNRNITHIRQKTPVEQAATPKDKPLIDTSNAALPTLAADPMNTAGIPLREAQHQYRALRDIYQTHGVLAGLLATSAVAGGAAAGGYFGGGSGAVLGGEAAGGITERAAFKDSWDRTSNGEAYRDGAGQKVSIGRDIAHYGFRLHEGTLPYNVVSGISDGIADIEIDPLARIGGIYHNVTEPLPLRGPEAIDEILAKKPKVAERVFGDIANKNAVEIANQYPQFRPIAADLGEAASREEVADVLRDALQGPELRSAKLPYFKPREAPSGDTFTLDEKGYAAPGIVDEPVGRVEALIRRARTKIPMELDSRKLAFTNTRIDPTNPDSVEGFRRLLNFSNMSSRLIDAYTRDWIYETDSGARRLMLRNALVRMTLSMGVGEDSSLVTRLRQTVSDEMGGLAGTEGNHFGYDMFGRDLSPVVTDEGTRTTAALFQGQRGDMEIPDYRGWLRATREAQGAKALYGRLDDFAYQRLIVPFKKLALFTGGFAVRIATAEAIPASVREGVVNTIRAGVSAKVGGSIAEDVAAGDAAEVEAAVVHSLRGPKGFVADERLVKRAVQLNWSNRRILPDALGADNYVADDALGKLEAARQNTWKAYQSSPTRLQESEQFGEINPKDPNFSTAWQRAAREAGHDEGMQRAAAAYRDAWQQASRETVQQGRQEVIDVASRGAAEPAVAELPPAATGEGVAATGQAPDVVVPEAAPRTAKYTNRELAKIATREARRADEAYLRNDIDPAILSDMARSRVAPAGLDPIEEMARQRVEALKGLVHPGAVDEDTISGPHMHVLDAIANGEAPDIGYLDALKANERPYSVKGRLTKDSMVGSWVDRIVNAGWHKVIDPIIGTVGREHQYLINFDRYMNDLDPLVAAGQLTEEEAITHAQIKTIRYVAKFVHNPYERSQLSVLGRNFAPFFFAQEQAYRRAGRLLQDNPEAFRRYQLLATQFQSTVSKQQGEDGNDYWMIPGLGYLDETAVRAMHAVGLPLAAAVPVTVLGNTRSLETVFPFGASPRPSWSPLVTIPAHIVEAMFPESRQQIHPLIGGAAEAGSVWDQLIPNTALRNLVHAFTNSEEGSVASGAAATFVALAYRQNVAMRKWIAAGHKATDKGAPRIVPPSNASPRERSEFITRVRNQARVNQIFRAILSTVSPLSPSMDVGDYGIKQEVQTYIDKYGISAGLDKFVADHPDASPYTITRTEAADNAPSVAPTREAGKFYRANEDLFRDYPAAAAYFVPQHPTDKYDRSVLQEQIAHGLRDVKSIKQVIDEFYINEGFAKYAQDKPIHDKALADVEGDSEATHDENATWSDYLQNTLGRQNPVWWDYFTATDRDNRRIRELADLRDILASKRAPKGKQADGIRGLIADLDTHLQALDDGRLSEWTREDRQAELDEWQAYLDDQAKKRPDLSIVITRLFKHVGAR